MRNKALVTLLRVVIDDPNCVNDRLRSHVAIANFDVVVKFFPGQYDPKTGSGFAEMFGLEEENTNVDPWGHNCLNQL